MKRFYKIFLLILLLVFLTTYSPIKIDIFSKKENYIFKIQNIEILNNKITNKKEIIKKLAHIYEKNIFFVEKEDLEKPLNSINFLEKIEVKKKYPDTIIVKIYETVPVAILFKKNKKYFLDSSSNLINFSDNMFSNDFSNIFGDNAEKEFINFYKELKINNFPREKIKNYYYFQIGRWDLQLLKGQMLKLPDTKLTDAIQQSIKIINREDFKNYKVIDLRIHGKIVVE